LYAIFNDQPAYILKALLTLVLKIFWIISAVVKMSNEEKTSLSQEEVLHQFVNRIFNNDQFREKIMMPTVMGRPVMKTMEEKTLDTITESCAFKSILSGVMGNFLEINNFTLLSISCNLK
jgi:hypothetical protein